MDLISTGNTSAPQELPIGETYRNGEANTTDTTMLASLSWRELFTDPSLQILIAAGLESNTSLQVGRLRVEQAEVALESSKAYRQGVQTSAQNHFDKIQGIIALYHALGGGTSIPL